MVTLIIRLCAICAASTLLEMAAIGSKMKDSLRVICGMIMLAVTIAQIKSIADSLTQQMDLLSFFECLIR